MRQFDIATDCLTTSLKGAAVGGLHDSRTSAGDHCASCARQHRASLLRGLIFRMFRWRAGRAKNGYAIFDMSQIFESLDELAHDAKDSPGIGMQKLICARHFQETIILGTAGWLSFVFVFVHLSSYIRFSLWSFTR